MLPSERSNRSSDHVSVLTEREGVNSWTFEIEMLEGEHRRVVFMNLAWVDYEYWSHGTASPSRVAEIVLHAVLLAEPARVIPDRFDASTARRWIGDLDQRVREML